MQLCLDSGLREDALTLIYSAVDTLGFVNSPSNQKWASEDSFEKWSDQYLLPALRPVLGEPLRSVDLYSARCGILHTSSSSSRLGASGNAREIWYQFRGESGVNLTLNTSGMPLLLDIDDLASAFRD